MACWLAPHLAVATAACLSVKTLCQVVVRELPKAWYKFLTTTCAVVGGVFTVAGILDSILHTGLSAVKKKVEIGKFT